MVANYMSSYYVHRHTMNYLNWGTYITNNKEGNKDLPSVAINRYRTIHENMINQFKDASGIKQAQGQDRDRELETKFERIVYGKGISSEEEKNKIDGIRQMLLEVYGETLEDEMKVDSNSFTKAYNLETLGEEASAITNKMHEKMEKSVRNVYALNKSNSAYSTTFIKIRDGLTKIIQDLGNTTEFKDYIAVQKKVAGMNTSMQGMINQINNITNSLLKKGSDSKYLIKYNPNTSNMRILRSYIEMLGTIPSLGLTNEQTGRLGEMTTAIVDYVLAAEINDGIIEENLKPSLLKIASSFKKGSSNIGTGYVGMNMELDLGLFFNKNLKNVFNDKFAVNNNDNTFGIELTGHRSKTDIILKSKAFGVIDQKVSVKNVSNSSHVSLVKGTTLSNILGSLDARGAFAGHYANIVSQTIDGGAGMVEDYRNTMERIIYQNILINAFQGYSQQEKPSIFLIYNNEAETVRIYDMNYLIGKVLEDDNYHISMKKVNTDNNGASIETRVTGLNNIEIPFRSNFGEMTISSQQLFRRHKINVSINMNRYA